MDEKNVCRCWYNDGCSENEDYTSCEDFDEDEMPEHLLHHAKKAWCYLLEQKMMKAYEDAWEIKLPK